ncbi:MAG: hypothetical protein Kow00105_11380 [Phycisphaeraceae bacterium]
MDVTGRFRVRLIKAGEYRYVFLSVLFVTLIATAVPVNAQFGELIAFQSPGNTTYYLDADAGNDENPGTRPRQAWRTLSRINTSRFAPGDRILIKAGTTYHGKLWPKGTGIPGRPITIDRFGDGPPPVIHGDGDASATILLDNVNAWHIKNLELTNTGDQPETFRYAISILIDGIGDAGDFHLANLHIHDVNGSDEPGFGEGAAILLRNRGVNTRFDGVTIEHCTIDNTHRNGIVIDGGDAEPGAQANIKVVIHDNVITGVGGDGIRLVGCEYPVVEYNRIEQAGQSGEGRAGGISLINCRNGIVQFNEVIGTRGPRNAALRVGPGCMENTLQFNFTRDNRGPMAQLSADIASTGSVGKRLSNIGTVVRYNISQNDGGGFKLIGPVRDARCYNNTIFCGPDRRVEWVRLDARRDMAPAQTLIANNLFYVQKGQASILFDETTDIMLRHNAYFGMEAIPASDPNPITADPMLPQPGRAETRDEAITDYQPLPDSPLAGAGVRVDGHGRLDFAGRSVPPVAEVDIGAIQITSDNGDEARPNVPPAPDKPEQSAGER